MTGIDRMRADAMSCFNIDLPALRDEPVDAFVDWHNVANVLAPLIVTRNDRVVGISGSQGSGKSTLAGIVAAALRKLGRQVLVCSLDDFYLGHEARRRLAETVHPLLRTRGVPGTHDTAWLGRVLAQATQMPCTLTVPRFDKATDDRAVASHTETLDTLILEGWCLGVEPEPESSLAVPVNDLEAVEDADGRWRRWVNAQIQAHYLGLWQAMDFWVHLRVPSFDQVLAWRTEQEAQLPGDARMDSVALERFVEHYERLTRWLWQVPARGPGAVLALDAQHRLAAASFGSGQRL